MQPLTPTPLRREQQAQPKYRPLYFTGWGLLLWAAATLIFRLAGHWFLVPESGLLLGAAYYGAVPVIALVTLPVYRLCRLDANTRLRAAVLIALPGIALDIFAMLLFSRIFPNLQAGSMGPFASWLFWAYGLILASGLVGGRSR